MRPIFYIALFRHWMRMVFGKSYWHASQGVGQNFCPGSLSDYYRDYSSKAVWMGAQDTMGFPLVQEPGGNVFYHPLILSQKALGHWSQWLVSNRTNSQHKEAFLAIAEWLCRNQEKSGAWRIPSMEKPIYTVPFSALAQGQAISVLARAFSISSKPEMFESARNGFSFMVRPVEEGGTTRWTTMGAVLEEYPKKSHNTVLNGWISALFGVYDFWLINQEKGVYDILESTLRALKSELAQFNAGFWSYYDTSGTLASPYYHQVHIVQLKALELAFPNHLVDFQVLRIEFERQLASKPCFLKAFCQKGWQKLKKPPTTVLVQPPRQAVPAPIPNPVKN